MTEEPATSTDQESIPRITLNATSSQENGMTAKEQVEDFLRDVQEKAGQISEIEMEEENLVNEFFDSLLKILKPFSETLEISASSIPEKYGEISNAHICLTGQLVMVYRDGKIRILDLSDRQNHELLVEITGEIMAQLKTIIDSYRLRIEKRIKFLLPITRELQKVAKVFSEK